MKLSAELSNAIGGIRGIAIPIGNAVALGLLDKALISRLVEHSYKSNPSYYDPGNYDYTWEEQIIEPLRAETSGANLLVAFCGKGRESRIFASHGYDVTGIDREDFMIEDAIEIGKKAGFDSKFECVDFNDYQTTTPYDIVYTSTWMYTTCLDQISRFEFLQKCKELRARDGLIVISYRIRRDTRMDALSQFLAKAVAVITFGNRTVSKGDRIENGLFWHYFTETEIEQELRAAGMDTCYHKPSENGKLEWRFLRPATAPLQA